MRVFLSLVEHELNELHEFIRNYGRITRIEHHKR